MNKLQSFSAVLKFINGSNIGKDYVQGVYDYITDPVKTDNGKLIATRGCSEDDPLRDILLTKKLFNKTGGKQIEHFIIAFPPGASSKKPKEILDVTTKILDTVFPDFQSISAFHTDSKAPHVHNILSSVNAVTGKKFSQSPSDLNRVKQKTNNILLKHGFDIITASANEFVDHTDYAKEEDFDFLELDEPKFITENTVEEISTFTDSVSLTNTNLFCGWDHPSCNDNYYGGYPMNNNYTPYVPQTQAMPVSTPTVEVVPSTTPTVQPAQDALVPAPSVEAVPTAVETLNNSLPTTSVVTGPTFRIKGTPESNFAGLNELVEQTVAYAQEHQREAANLALAMQQYGQQSGYPSNVSIYAGPIFDIDMTGGIYSPLPGYDGNK